jgi:two-component system, OmpR family, sensor histidine kinase KdpD
MSKSVPGALFPYTEVPGIHPDHTTSQAQKPFAISHHLRDTYRVVSRALRPYAGSLALTLVALAIGIPINVLLDVSSMSRVFLIAVLISAISYGLWPAMFAASISVVICDFFFIPPVYSLAIHSVTDIVNLAFFAVTAVVVSGLAARVRRYAVLADKRALTAEKLSAFTRRVGSALTVEEVLARSSEDVAAAMGTSVVTLLTERDRLIRNSIRSSGTEPGADVFQRLEQRLAAQPLGPEGLTADGWLFHELRCDEATSCLIGVRLPWATSTIGAEEQHLLQAFAQQAVSAVEHNRLRQRLDDARARIASEEFAAALLNSISHDLRGPLTTILGATSALDLHWPSLREEAKIELVQTAREESGHLSAYINNLLEITRIEFGAIGPNLIALELADVVGSAAYKARAVLSAHRLKIDVSEELPLVTADAALLQQTIVNLLDNAAKYSPHGSPISVVADTDRTSISLRIIDEGPGLPNSDLDRIFDKFFRSASTRNKQPGTGLGLTICRGLVEAMHGTIEARNRSEHSGLCISITLPAAHANQLARIEYE